MKLDLTNNNNPEKSMGIVDVVDRRYFVPSIEDIRVGYECEKRTCVQDSCEYKPYILTSIPDRRSLEVFYRVPYLTKEQIEKNLEMSGISCIFDSDKCILKLYDDKNTYFYGLCKSVNELRQLLGYIKSAI